jgi:hypothetical protein
MTDARTGLPIGDNPAPPPGVLAMRTGGSSPAGSPVEQGNGNGDGAIDLSTDRIAAKIAAAPRAVAPPPSNTDESNEMVPNGHGTYVHDRQTFRIDIARDGSVRIRDKPNFRADIGLPCIRCVTEDFEKWKRDPYSGHVVNLMGLLPVLRGGFDLTDWLERTVGNDPYSYEKARFMEATRERRAEMSATARRERMRDALAKLPDFLAAVWAHEPWSERERRYILFKLWDECDDSNDGAQARATINAFVRKQVPSYSNDEIEALNEERTSEQRFEPYTKAEPRE